LGSDRANAQAANFEQWLWSRASSKDEASKLISQLNNDDGMAELAMQFADNL